MEEKKQQLLLIPGFLLIGFTIRLYPLFYPNIINPDGANYINQARAILNGDWELALKCGFEFISIYHVLIPLFYKVFGDWVTAAKSISLLFGTLTIVPFYLISRQFFKGYPLLLANLAFAINPFLVSHSEDLIKGPIFWFFALLGIYFFITVFNKNKHKYFLILSCASFLIASWARLEAVTYLIGSILYIIFSGKERSKNLLLFCSPLFAILFLSLFGFLSYESGGSLWSLYVGPRILVFIDSFLHFEFGENFIGKSLSGLGLIFLRMLRVIYIPFLVLLIPGLWILKSELNRNKHFSYFILLFSLSFVALFVFYQKTGTMVDRYAAFVILPIFIFVCSGIDRIIHFFNARGFQERKIILALLAFIIIIVIAFPQNLVHRRKDQVIYEEIGKYLARLEKNHYVKVLAPDSRVALFATLKSEGLQCTKNNFQDYNLLTNDSYPETIESIRKNKYKYFLWEKNYWKNKKYNFLEVVKPEDFLMLKEWNFRGNQLIVYEIGQIK